MNDLINVKDTAMSKNINRILPLFLAFLFTINLGIGLPLPINAAEEEQYIYNNYRIDYEIRDEWTDNQSVSVTITNTSDESLLNWALALDATGEISGIWNATQPQLQPTAYPTTSVPLNKR
jgi:hypothetical protein